MPSNIIKTLNRTAIAPISTVEFGFTAIEIPKQNLDVYIHSLTFGCLNIDVADKNAFVSQYVAILRNANITENTTAFPLDPLAFPSGSEILWFGNASNVGSVNTVNFGKSFVLPAGNDYLVYCCVPAYNGVRTATVYPFVSINANVDQGENTTSAWRMR